MMMAPVKLLNIIMHYFRLAVFFLLAASPDRYRANVVKKNLPCERKVTYNDKQI